MSTPENCGRAHGDREVTLPTLTMEEMRALLAHAKTAEAQDDVAELIGADLIGVDPSIGDLWLAKPISPIATELSSRD
jgi:hypothetical protein